MALCTVADVEALLQGDIDPDNDPVIVALLEMAEDKIIEQLGRDPNAGQTVTGERTYLPAGSRRTSILTDLWPLASVDDITEDGTTLTAGTDYEADLETGTIYRLNSSGGRTWWTQAVPILVDYTTAIVPGTRTICAQATARAFKAGRDYATRPAVLDGLRQLTIGRWSATRETGSQTDRSEPISLTESESTSILRWRDRRP